MAQGRTVVEILHPEDHVTLDNLADRSLTLRQLQTTLNALAIGVLGHQDTTVFVSQGGAQAAGSVALSGVGGTAATGTVTVAGVDGTAATGSYALSNVGGAAASGTVTLGGGAGDVTVVINGESLGPVPFNTDDATTAEDLADAITGEGDFNGLGFSATSLGAVVTIVATSKGTAGNVTLTASRTAGTATASGATLTGGLDGAVTVVINGVSVGPTDTTDLSDTDAATAIAVAIDANGTLGPLLVAVGSTTNVNLTWGVKGTVGNAVTLGVGVSDTGTATRSAATLTGGANNTVTVTVDGTAVPTDTTTLANNAAATAVAAALQADATFAAKASASAGTNIVTITWDTKGTVGDAKTLTAATSATGTATASGATLAGGAQGSVTITVNGTAEVTDTTDLTDAEAATLCATELNANGTINDFVTAAADGDDVLLTAVAYGLTGNLITLLAASDTGTATASGATLTGGTEATGQFLERP